jgi:FkbM family methyltransferase
MAEMNIRYKLNQRLRGLLPWSKEELPAPLFQVPKTELRQYLPVAPVIVEAGAHNGTDTVELAQLWKQGSVHAFEPVPSLFFELRKKTQNLANVFCYPLALAAQQGKQRLNVSGGDSDGSSSLLEPALHRTFHPGVTFDNKIEVEAVTLDSWARDHAVGNIDLLWLDLQGMEPAVLRSSSRTLSGVRAVYAEVSLEKVYEGTELYPQFRAWMESQGFGVVQEFLPFPDMGNVLFVHR